MPTRTLGLFILVAVTHAAPAASVEQDPRAQALTPLRVGTSAIAGRVVDQQTGVPIRDAVVFVREVGTRTGALTRTDGDGAFRFEQIDAGAYRIGVQATGYGLRMYGATEPFDPGRAITLALGQQLTSIVVKLEGTGTIAGRILDETGDAIPMVNVFLVPRDPRRGSSRGIRRFVRADEQGHYSFDDVPPGDWIISAHGLGLRPGTPITEPHIEYRETYFPGVTNPSDAQAVRIATGVAVSEMNFTLRRPVSYTLRVPLAYGDDIDKDTIEVVLTNHTGISTRRAISRTVRRDDVIEIPLLQPGRYLLWARGATPHGSRAAMREVAINGDITEATLLLEPTATISGRVIADDADRELPTGVRVAAPLMLPSGRATLFPVDSVEVDVDGRFVLRGLFGRRSLRLTGLTSPWTLRRVVVGGRELPPDAVIDLSAGQTLDDVAFVVGRER